MRKLNIRKVKKQIGAIVLMGTLTLPIAFPLPAWAYDLQLPPPPPDSNFRLTADVPLSTVLTNLGAELFGPLGAFLAPKSKTTAAKPENISAAKEKLEKTVRGIDTQMEGPQFVKVGQVISLSGIPVDKNHNPVNGLSVKWRSETPDVVQIINDSQAVVLNEGNAKLSVSSANIKKEISLAATLVDDPPEILPVLTDQQANELVLPENNLGNAPGQMDSSSLTSGFGIRAARTREKYGSSNYSFDIPFASLPGRGINAAVGMTYNSRVWDKTEYFGTTYNYNLDQNWLAPGFEVGLGSIEGFPSGYLLNGPDGGRTQLIQKSVSGSCTTFEATDGTFVQALRCGNFDASSMTAKYTDGTEVTFGTVIAATGKRYPIKITDRNGNFINIAYVANDTKGKIAYIKDTLERYITFHYDTTADQKLVAVSVPAFDNSTTPHQTIRFYYEDIPLNWNGRFESGASVNAPTTIKVLRNVYFPGTQNGYRYEYSQYYGVIYKISQRRGMQVSTDSVTETGTVTNEGTEAAWTHYNYAATAMELGDPLTDVPKYNWRKDDWLGRTTEVPQTTFHSDENITTVNGLKTGTRTITVTAPDGSKSISIAKVNQAVWDDGLMQEMRQVTIENGQERIWAKTKMYWQQGDTTGGRQNPRLQKVESTNDAGQIKATSYEYDNFNNQTVVREHDFAAEETLGTELRRTEIAYETGSGWVNSRLIRLPKTVQTVVNTAVVSKIKYEYDNYQNNSLTNTSGVMQHDQRYDPFNPGTHQCNCRWECDVALRNSYNGGTDGEDPNLQPSCPDGLPPVRVCDSCPNTPNSFRGNVTKAIAFPDTSAQDNDSNNSVQTMRYDITGNVVEASVSCCSVKTIEYDLANGYAYPISEAKGVGGVQMMTSITYDRNTGLVKTATDENGQTASITYDPVSLRVTRTDSPSGAWTTTEYNGTNYPYFVKQTESLDANRSVSNWTFSNGIEQGFRSRGQTPNGYISSDVEFDIMGQVVKSYSPYTVAALTDPRPQDVKYSEITQRDGLGRTLQTKLTDLTTVNASYNGLVSTATDQSGKSRRQIMDALGRLVRVDEPDVNGILGAVNSPIQPTSYEYDGNDNLTKVIQSDGTATQERLFKYDSLSRITHEKQIEATATLDDNGVKVGSGGLWTGVYKYDKDSLLLEGVDARGVKTTFTYDGLNRVKTVTYSGETGYQTPSVTYTYDEAENGFYNIGRLTKVQTAANANYGTPETIQNYDYDKTAQVVKHIQSIGNETYQLEYGYNLAGQLISEKYPSGRVVTMAVDNFGRLATVADAQRTYLTGVTFNDQGLLSQINLGNFTNESYAYNDRFQMTSQTLQRGSAEILSKFEYSHGQTDLATGNVDATKNNGQLGKVENWIGTDKQWSQRFGYDELGRLSEAREHKQGDNGQLTYRQKFDFDRFGNLYRKAASNPTTGQQNPLPYTPIEDGDISKSTNRFTSGTGTTYNEAGQVITDNKFRSMGFNYDANGRTVKATKANTPDAWTVYDALGNRVATKINDVWQFMIYDAFGKLVAEYGGNSGTSIGGVNSVKYIQQDWQGSVRTVTNNAAYVVSRTDHQVFGEEIGAGIGLRTAQKGFDNPAGQRQGYGLTEKDDATGLSHTLFRKNESQAGRWTSPDPYKGSISYINPQSLNRYPYVLSDPNSFVDPTGLCTFQINITGNLNKSARSAAEKEITRIFAQAGHNVIFGSSGSADARFNIDVGNFANASVSTASTTALGATRVTNGTVTDQGSAYIDRIQSSITTGTAGALGMHPTNLGRALGRVIAHEAGHSFLNLNGHGSTGLMREQFVGNSDLFRDGKAYNDAYKFSSQEAATLANKCKPQTTPQSPPTGGGGGGGGWVGWGSGRSCTPYYWVYYESWDGGQTWEMVDASYAGCW